MRELLVPFLVAAFAYALAWLADGIPASAAAIGSFTMVHVAYYLGISEAEKMRDRLLRGDCMYCGYDLTGNVSGTCPECGRVTVK